MSSEFNVGVIGGGQLARMLIPAAQRLGIRLLALDPNPDCPARLVLERPALPQDGSAVRRLASMAQVVTVEHELLDLDLLRSLQTHTSVWPSPDSLEIIRNKLTLRQRLVRLNLPQPEWSEVTGYKSVKAFLAEHGQAVLKLASGGYDGRGVRFISRVEQAQDWLSGVDPLLIEEKIDFDQEVSQLIARRQGGCTELWSLTQTRQKNGMCYQTLTGLKSLQPLAAQAKNLARQIAEAIGLVGVMAVEMFAVKGKLLINEIALRPHNSGHWSIEGSVTSQFEQHLRAILDLPLGDGSAVAPLAFMQNLINRPNRLDRRLVRVLETLPQAKIHLYEKSSRPGRKVGHITLLGADMAELKPQIEQLEKLVGN